VSQRTLSGVLAVTLLGQVCIADLAVASVWDDRRVKPPPSAGALAALPVAGPAADALVRRFPELSASLDRAALRAPSAPRLSVLDAIPQNVASLRTVHRGPNDGAPLVILVQDIHLQEEAQRNIATVLNSVAAASGATVLVGVEGAFGAADFAPYRSGADARLTAEVASDFLKDGRIAAPSFVGLTADGRTPAFVGVDDAVHYRRNVAALLSAQKVSGQAALRVATERSGLRKKISGAGDSLTSRLDDARENFHIGKTGLADFVKALIGLRRGAHRADEPMELVLERFLSAQELESSLDFARVERERRSVIERLAQTASVAKLEDLAAWSLAYRSGQLSFGAFHARLRTMMAEQDGGPSRHPEFDRYLTYVILAEGLSGAEVSAATRRLSAELGRAVASADHRILLARAEDLRLRERLISFSLTPEEWEDVRKSDPVEGLEAFEDFYREADLRSVSMASNLARELERAKGTIAVLVAGGFHTDHLVTQLNRRGLSVAVVQPKVTRIEGTGTEYLGLFARDKALLDQLFAGDKLFLARASTNLGFGAVGRAAGEAFVAERARRSVRVSAPRAPPGFRSGKVQVRLLPILAVSILLAGIIGIYGAKSPVAPPAAVAPVANVVAPTTQSGRESGQLPDQQLLNLRAMRQSIERVIQATDAKQSAGYRNAVHTLLMGAAFSQSGGHLESHGSRITLFDLDAGFFLDAMIDAGMQKRVTNAGGFSEVGAALLGDPAMASLIPALNDLAKQRAAAWAQLEAGANSKGLAGEARTQWIDEQKMVWLNRAATVFSVVPAADRAPGRFDMWIHTNGSAAALAARIKLWEDPEPLIPKRGRPADLTPLVANHAERLGVDREAFLADYDLMPAEFRVLPAFVTPVGNRAPAPSAAASRPAATVPAPILSGVPKTPQEGLSQVTNALSRVLHMAYADRTYEEKNGVYFYLLLTASHESGGFRWIQQMTRGAEGKLVPGGPAKSFFGIETWSAMDDIPYLAARSNGRDWFVASMGEANGNAFWTALSRFMPVIRSAYYDIDKRLRSEGLAGRDLRRRTSAERTRWLRANIRSFTVDLVDDAEGPIDFDRLLVRTDVAVPFAVSKDRRYRKEIIPEAGDLTMAFMSRIYPDYKARWNTMGGAATEKKFIGDGERLMAMPDGKKRLARGTIAMLWSLRAGLVFFSPLARFLPVMAIRFLVVTVFVPLVEMWAAPLPWFAGWHRNVSAEQYRHRVALQAVVLALSLASAGAFGGSPQDTLLLFGAGLYIFHSGVNAVEFFRTDGNLDDFAAIDAPHARRRVAAALVLIGPRALPQDLNLDPAELPAAGRLLLALDAAIDRTDLSIDVVARRLAPALRAIARAEEGQVKTPSEIGGAGLRLHVLNAGEDAVLAARALSRERRAGRHDLILTSAAGEDLAFLNASAAQPGVTFVNRDSLRAGTVEETAARLGVSASALKIIVGQSASLDDALVNALRSLGGGEAEIYLKVGTSAGLAAALLVQIDGYRLTEMLRHQVEIARLVATQA